MREQALRWLRPSGHAGAACGVLRELSAGVPGAAPRLRPQLPCLLMVLITMIPIFSTAGYCSKS